MNYGTGVNHATAVANRTIEKKLREIADLKSQVSQLQKIREDLNNKLRYAQAQTVGTNAVHCALAKALKEANPDHPLCKSVSEEGSARFSIYHEAANTEFDKYVPR